MDLSGVIGVVGGAVGLLVAIGGVVVYLRGAWDKGTIANLELNNASLDARVKVLEADLADAKHDLVDANARIGALERENTALLKVRPSAEIISEIHADLLRHDSDIKRILGAGEAAQ